jgi:hypothetical protein
VIRRTGTSTTPPSKASWWQPTAAGTPSSTTTSPSTRLAVPATARSQRAVSLRVIRTQSVRAKESDQHG